MSYLLDSNILIGFLNGDKKIANWIFNEKDYDYINLNISFIAKIEVLSLKTLKENQIEEIEKFLNIFQEIYINSEIIKIAAAMRRKNFLTLGDAIIAASAIYRKLILVTNDKKLAFKLKDLIDVVSI